MVAGGRRPGAGALEAFCPSVIMAASVHGRQKTSATEIRIMGTAHDFLRTMRSVRSSGLPRSHVAGVDCVGLSCHDRVHAAGHLQAQER
jgi:hypothetical protein